MRNCNGKTGNKRAHFATKTLSNLTCLSNRVATLGTGKQRRRKASNLIRQTEERGALVVRRKRRRRRRSEGKNERTNNANLTGLEADGGKEASSTWRAREGNKSHSQSRKESWRRLKRTLGDPQTEQRPLGGVRRSYPRMGV